MRALPTLRWSRADTLATHLILVLGIGLSVLGATAQLLWVALGIGSGTSSGAVTATRPDGVPEPRTEAPTSAQDVTVTDTGRMVIEFHDPTAWERFLIAAPGLLGVSATLLVLLMVWSLVRGLGAGDPFVPANARRVYVIALTVLIGSVVVPTVAAVCENVLRGRALESDEIAFSFVVFGEGGISLPLVLTGFLLAALAEVFRRGTALRADVEGLV
ncbi:DUF2975 domain-containing protein [Nocardiopsis sp. YSL2]|uniref:DUF2975 domain-containing protein n=1 Tax=Nocardiopsis sp. YSL2 TaxID=2939492 RepID=UPI0026F46513|nr:DUF2975 domain-containing protein [Nocardiopsis sp. YSL2]